MKTHHYAREETDTFDEVNKVFNELREEIVGDSEVVDNVITRLITRIAKLDKKVEELTPESPVAKNKPPKKKPPKK